MTDIETPSPVPPHVRADLLNRELNLAVSGGFSVESRTSTEAVVSKQETIGWFWNTLLTLCTFGLWLIVVIYRVLNRKVERVAIAVDEYGRVFRTHSSTR